MQMCCSQNYAGTISKCLFITFLIMQSILNTAHSPQHWLIECTFATTCPTKTRDLLLNRELVVISDLFCGLNVSLGVDDNPLLIYYSSITVGLQNQRTPALCSDNYIANQLTNPACIVEMLSLCYLISTHTYVHLTC